MTASLLVTKHVLVDTGRTTPATPHEGSAVPAASATPASAVRTARSTSVPSGTPARLLRCVGDRLAPEVDLREESRRVPEHVVRGRKPGPPAVSVPLPDPTALCCAVVRAAIEVVRGERTVSQLARWVSPEIYDALARRARLALDAPVTEPTTRPVTIRRARILRIGDGVAEGTVVVEDGDRVRAAAARLEARRGTWRVVALEIG